MTRHRTTPKTTTAIRFPAELHEQLTAAADEHDRSVNWLVIKAVEDFLPRLVPASEVRLTRDPQSGSQT